jgi:hypothetical protein
LGIWWLAGLWFYMFAPSQLRLLHLSRFSKGAHSVSQQPWFFLRDPSALTSSPSSIPRTIFPAAAILFLSGEGPHLHFSHEQFVHHALGAYLK